MSVLCAQLISDLRDRDVRGNADTLQTKTNVMNSTLNNA